MKTNKRTHRIGTMRGSTSASLTNLISLLAVCLLLWIQLATATVSIDWDSMSDVWEEHFDLASEPEPDRTESSDPDGDGFTNLEESIGGTDPSFNSTAEKPDFWPSDDPNYDDEEEVYEFRWNDKNYKKYYVQGYNGSNWVNLSGPHTGNGGASLQVTVEEAEAFGPSSANYRLVINEANNSDSDILNDWEEYILGTTRTDSDTDNDGMDDGWEYIHGLDPLSSSDASLDPDGDNYTNLDEYNFKMDPNLAYPDVSFDDFESGRGNWNNVTGDDEDWRPESNGTPSSTTGPTNDHTLGAGGGGTFVYMETSSGYAYSSGDTVIFESGTYDANRFDLEFSMFYHMYGANMGTLNVDVHASGSWNNGVWSRTGQQHGSHTAAYSEAIVDLSGYSGNIKLRIRGVAAGSWKGDMAFDDLKVYATDATPDADNDGLGDPWEITHFGNLGQGAAGDPDADGLSNLDEYNGGSDPNAKDNTAVALVIFEPLRN